MIAARHVKGDKEWGYPTFQVNLPDEKQLNLVDAINKTKPDDTPKFNGNAPQAKSPTTQEAAAEPRYQARRRRNARGQGEEIAAAWHGHLAHANVTAGRGQCTSLRVPRAPPV